MRIALKPESGRDFPQEELQVPRHDDPPQGSAIKGFRAAVLGRMSSVLLFGLLVFGFSWCHQRNYRFATPVSRLDLLHAIVEDGSVSIDRHHTNTLDKAIYGGHYCSDKAPGTAALALAPFFVSACGLTLLSVDLDSESGWLFSSLFRDLLVNFHWAG